jgi:hypothetical protein
MPLFIMAKKKSKAKKIVVIQPNAGEVIKDFSKKSGKEFYRNTKTGKISSKKDYVKSNFDLILSNPKGFPKLQKSAKGTKSYYNQLRFDGKVLPKEYQEFIKKQLNKPEQKDFREYKKEKGFIKDLSYIYTQKQYDILLNNFKFTFDKWTAYNMTTGFLNVTTDDMHNIISEIARYRDKGYKVVIVDEEGNTSNDISVIKNFEKNQVNAAQELVSNGLTKKDATAYVYNVKHSLVINQLAKTVTINLQDSSGFFSDSK